MEGLIIGFFIVLGVFCLVLAEHAKIKDAGDWIPLTFTGLVILGTVIKELGP